MKYIKNIIERYKHIRSIKQLQQVPKGMYAFVGFGNHSTSNLYPVLGYLHVPLKYICCKSAHPTNPVGRYADANPKLLPNDT